MFTVPFLMTIFILSTIIYSIQSIGFNLKQAFLIILYVILLFTSTHFQFD